MPGSYQSDIKLGFFAGIGLLVLALLLGVVQFVLGRARG